MADLRRPPVHLIPPLLARGDTLLRDAARRFGTPLYLYHQRGVAHAYEKLSAALGPGVDLHYSLKANPLLEIVETLRGLGAGVEVSSPAELATARAAGVAPENVLYLGPAKGTRELQGALGGGVIVAESTGEVGRIHRAAKAAGVVQDVALRVNLSGGGGDLRMGGATQFGMDFSRAASVLCRADRWPGVRIVGVQSFSGTRLLDPDRLARALAGVLDAADALQRRTGAEFSFVDMGGGFGIPLYDGEAPLDLARLGALLVPPLARYRSRWPRTRRIAVESGRYLVGEAGVLLCRVIDTKRAGGKRYALLDGGLHVIGGRDGYLGARLTPLRVVGEGHRHAARHRPVTLCGPLCTPADRVAADVALPPLRPGDLVAFYQAGAYGPTASAGMFLSRGFPAEAMVAADGALTLLHPAWGPETLLSLQRRDEVRPCARR